MDPRISNKEQVSYIRRYTINDGCENGVKVMELYNGKLRALLNESKALDIMQLFHEGTNVSFISKNGFSLKNDGFSTRFEGGMLYTVGLDAAGAIEGHLVHGSIHNAIPTITRMEIVDDKIIVEAEIKDTELFGNNLLLKRKYELKAFANELKLKDTLTNFDTADAKYCLLYHNNIGYPMLDDGDKIVGKFAYIQPRNELSKTRIDSINDVKYPVDNEVESCYFIKNDKGEVSLINNKINKKFTLSYSIDTLPEFILWKSMKSQDYAVGFEPSTTKLDDFFKYNVLKPNETKSFSLTYKVINK